jgi:hypothetical protein
MPDALGDLVKADPTTPALEKAAPSQVGLMLDELAAAPQTFHRRL